MIVKCSHCGKEHNEDSKEIIKIVSRVTKEVYWYCDNGFCAIAQQLSTIGF